MTRNPGTKWFGGEKSRQMEIEKLDGQEVGHKEKFRLKEKIGVKDFMEDSAIGDTSNRWMWVLICYSRDWRKYNARMKKG